MIEVKNLKKSFGSNLVLDGINYQINKGEKIVIVGPSGSGKSTFLRCLNLLEKPTEGEIWFEGRVDFRSEMQNRPCPPQNGEWCSSILICFHTFPLWIISRWLLSS